VPLEEKFGTHYINLYGTKVKAKKEKMATDINLVPGSENVYSSLTATQ
jgi:hypothetical protein